MSNGSFITESSRRTPWIVLEPGKIFIMGRSIPDDPGVLYNPVINWVSEYVKSYKGKTRVELGFEYINTSSTKWIFLLLRLLSEMDDIASNVSVSWYYELGDEDMSELGFILRSVVECPFVVVELLKMTRPEYERILSREE